MNGNGKYFSPGVELLAFAFATVILLPLLYWIVCGIVVVSRFMWRVMAAAI